jgi:hypothetical protein
MYFVGRLEILTASISTNFVFRKCFILIACNKFCIEHNSVVIFCLRSDTASVPSTQLLYLLPPYFQII